MADEAQRTGGIFLPYPLLGILMALVLALGGGIIGLYTQLSAMNTTMIMRDADNLQKQNYLQNKLELLETYVHDDRLKLKGLEKDIDNIQAKRN